MPHADYSGIDRAIASERHNREAPIRAELDRLRGEVHRLSAALAQSREENAGLRHAIDNMTNGDK